MQVETSQGDVIWFMQNMYIFQAGCYPPFALKIRQFLGKADLDGSDMKIYPIHAPTEYLSSVQPY